MQTEVHYLEKGSPSISWSDRVWEKAELKWIARDGQDRYYRDKVAIPGLLRSIITKCEPSAIELVDIGSGDGYCTDRLAAEIARVGFNTKNFFLLDRSVQQLNIAAKRSFLRGAVEIKCDFLDSNWSSNIPLGKHRRIFISTFVIQELQSLQPLLNGLAELMDDKDIAFFLTVAPSYSNNLVQKSLIRSKINGETKDDWRWRGLYPIDCPNGHFYLPHFQHTVRDYKNIFNNNGFRMVDASYLRVPVSSEANAVFSGTLYGKGIVGTRSSVIMTFKKRPTHRRF